MELIHEHFSFTLYLTLANFSLLPTYYWDKLKCMPNQNAVFYPLVGVLRKNIYICYMRFVPCIIMLTIWVGSFFFPFAFDFFYFYSYKFSIFIGGIYQNLIIFQLWIILQFIYVFCCCLLILLLTKIKSLPLFGHWE